MILIILNHQKMININHHKNKDIKWDSIILKLQKN
jgi:hypothetical protein